MKDFHIGFGPCHLDARKAGQGSVPIRGNEAKGWTGYSENSLGSRSFREFFLLRKAVGSGEVS